ncbi:fructose PTS transporter subunit IIB [Escherichia coli]|nr:PTS transporter subunit EIIA [Escherichia coli]EHE2570953.1 PTS transporter subunit EIIA [Escherichia coli]
MSKKLIALCACPMGLAHTFMAAQALEEAAVEAGYEVKIETQGADGIQNRLTAQDIAEATIIIHSVAVTGVGFGVAIPHTKSQWIRHSSISIARLVKPVDWQSEMGEVELVIMLTLGANEGMNHVKVFSQLARKLVNKNFRQSLFAAQDAQSILTLLETELTF